MLGFLARDDTFEKAGKGIVSLDPKLPSLKTGKDLM